MKVKLIVLILIFSSCTSGSKDVTDITTTTIPPDTTTTIPPDTTTTLQETTSKVHGYELNVGDCFNVLTSEGSVLDEQELIEKVSCSLGHQYEVVTLTNYHATEETEFNKDGIPNLDIYNECVSAYEDKFGRPIGGTSTLISWIGNTESFKEDREYKCFVMAYDNLNGPSMLSTTYIEYLNYKIRNFSTKVISELDEGDCFWHREIDADLIFYSEVDLVPCNEVHSHEIIKIYDFPEGTMTQEELFGWSFKACYVATAAYNILTYFEEDYEHVTIKAIPLFDDVAYALGDQTKAYCIVHFFPYGDTEGDILQKDRSLTNLFDYWFLDPSQNVPIDNEIILYCPTEDAILESPSKSEYILLFSIESLPIESIQIIYFEDEIEYVVDLTSEYTINNYVNMSTNISIYETFFLYYKSGRSLADLGGLYEGSKYPESIKFQLVDSSGTAYEATCFEE